MAKKKNYEFRESKQYNRNGDGLKQRRLKDEARWKFNPNADYSEEDNEDQEDDWSEDYDSEYDRR